MLPANLDREHSQCNQEATAVLSIYVGFPSACITAVYRCSTAIYTAIERTVLIHCRVMRLPSSQTTQQYCQKVNLRIEEVLLILLSMHTGHGTGNTSLQTEQPLHTNSCKTTRPKATVATSGKVGDCTLEKVKYLLRGRHQFHSSLELPRNVATRSARTDSNLSSSLVSGSHSTTAVTYQPQVTFMTAMDSASACVLVRVVFPFDLGNRNEHISYRLKVQLIGCCSGGRT